MERAEAEPWQRAAACVALGPTLDEPGIQRIEALAVLTTIPGLHDVFLAVATSDDELLSKAVRGLLQSQ